MVLALVIEHTSYLQMQKILFLQPVKNFLYMRQILLSFAGELFLVRLMIHSDNVIDDSEQGPGFWVITVAKSLGFGWEMEV